MDSQVLEAVSEAVHDAWIKSKLDAGITSRRFDVTGEEMIVPYAQLSDECKELDRATVRAVLSALPAAGYSVVHRDDAALAGWD